MWCDIVCSRDFFTMSQFVPVKDNCEILDAQDFIFAHNQSDLPIKIEPADVSWKPTKRNEPAIGKEPLLYFLSGTGCLVGEVSPEKEGADGFACIRSAQIVRHLFANKFDHTLPHLHKAMVPILHYGPQVSITEVTIPPSGEGTGELRRTSTRFLQTLDPRWVSTSGLFRKYDPFTDDARWMVWDTALESRCTCNLVCLLFHIESEVGKKEKVSNAILSICSKKKAVRITGTKQPSELEGVVPELAERDLLEISVNGSSFVVVNTDAAMLRLSTGSLEEILDLMVTTICFCPLEEKGLPLNRQNFMDVNYLRHKSEICRLDTKHVPELPEQFRYLLNAQPDDELDTPVAPSLVQFKKMEGLMAKGLKHRVRYEVGSYVVMNLTKVDGIQVTVARGFIAHLPYFQPEALPVKKFVLRGKQNESERFVGVCFIEHVEAKYADTKYEIGLKDRTGYEVQTISEFVSGEEYLWDLCGLKPLHHRGKVGNDVKHIMKIAKAQFLVRWNEKHKEAYTAEYPYPPNWRRWNMEDRSIVPIEL